MYKISGHITHVQETELNGCLSPDLVQKRVIKEKKPQGEAMDIYPFTGESESGKRGEWRKGKTATPTTMPSVSTIINRFSLLSSLQLFVVCYTFLCGLWRYILKPPLSVSITHTNSITTKATGTMLLPLPSSLALFSVLLYLLASFSTPNGEQLIIVNNCNESIWPGMLGNAGKPTPKDGGFHLGCGEEVVLDVPPKWSGRLWGRQGCSFDSDGKGSCDTGDCSGFLHCQGMGGIPPATVVEMTLGTSISPLHFYDVSLVDGFNLPVSMAPVGGGIGCGVASCDVDLNICCPSALEVKKDGRIVGCKSACLAMQSARYCCTGEYSNPKTCKPTLFANLFKAICPKAYSYAFDDSTSLNKCRAQRYVITFCPPK